MPLTLVTFPPPSPADGSRLNAVLESALAGMDIVRKPWTDTLDLRGQTLLFAVSLDDVGMNLSCVQAISALRRAPDLLEGSTAGIIVDGNSSLYTKSVASELSLALNFSGCALIGRPLVEATDTLANFRVQAKNLGCDLLTAYREAVRDLALRLTREHFSPRKGKAKLLVLHASIRRTSNTLDLWSQVRDRLGDRFEVTEMGLRNGTLSDCSGCPYTMCLHFGERGGCFYGGVMQEEVYPAVRAADAIVMLCPNYNDALSANLTAFINRLTALFRQTRFYDKALFAIVVSGYSGGDIVARQLISAMNMNKSFHLPARFALMETANDPGEALALPGIQDRLDAFAENIRHTMLA